MAVYRTKQRVKLLDYLAGHVDETLSAQQIASALDETEISLSAVYRNLATLEQENLVRRVSKEGSREVYFQYIAAPACRECLHLSCKQCGRMYHMPTQEAQSLLGEVLRSEGFEIDQRDTVLYGVCASCRTV